MYQALIKKTRFFQLSAVALLLVVMSLSLSGSVHAEPAQDQGTVTRLQSYCKRLLTSEKFKGDINSACSEGKMTRARNAATWKVKFTKESIADGSAAGQVYAQAQSFLKQAINVNPQPKTADKFNDALDGVYKANNLDASKPNPASNTSGSSGGAGGDKASDPNAGCDGDNCDFIKKYVNPGINLLSVAFGLIAIISLIMGGIQYSASQGDPQKVTKGKQRIGNTVMAIVAFMFLYSFLQFLVPGGLFNR